MRHELRAAYQRERYMKKKLAGICLQCKEPAKPDSVRCAKHHEEHRLYELISRRKERNKPYEEVWNQLQEIKV